MENNMEKVYENIVKEFLFEKFCNDECWENEYGTTKKNSMNQKEDFRNINNVKVRYQMDRIIGIRTMVKF